MDLVQTCKVIAFNLNLKEEPLSKVQLLGDYVLLSCSGVSCWLSPITKRVVIRVVMVLTGGWGYIGNLMDELTVIVISFY